MITSKQLQNIQLKMVKCIGCGCKKDKGLVLCKDCYIDYNSYKMNFNHWLNMKKNLTK